MFCRLDSGYYYGDLGSTGFGRSVGSAPRFGLFVATASYPWRVPPRNPHGRNGDKLRIPLPFEDAVKAALEVAPGEKKSPKKKSPKKSRPGV